MLFLQKYDIQPICDTKKVRKSDKSPILLEKCNDISAECRQNPAKSAPQTDCWDRSSFSSRLKHGKNSKCCHNAIVKMVKIFQKTVKIVKKCQRQKLSKWSNIVKIVNIVKNCQICQNCQVLRKFSKLSKIVKIVRIVENCRFCQFCASGESGQSAGSVQSGPHLLTKTFRPKIEEKNQQTFAGTTFIAVVFSVSFSRNVAMSMGRPFSGSLQNKVYSVHRWGRR